MSPSSKWAIAVLALVLAWSTLMVLLGHETALVALLPSMGLLVQQFLVGRGASGGAAESGATADGSEGAR
ncbi:hypothetical protein ACF1HU_36230 [Streptomyces olivaceus]|uniref:hypothetical protein n=1 Tax=Streptomyces olivaceus TaxID=47716 RepID=UPI001CCFEFAC|nr:hypothetical protein [Streptomyces olivaceus]MBZ6107938.1 hypothetical protein [Streptomyces olivaceus]